MEVLEDLVEVVMQNKTAQMVLVVVEEEINRVYIQHGREVETGCS